MLTDPIKQRELANLLTEQWPDLRESIENDPVSQFVRNHGIPVLVPGRQYKYDPSDEEQVGGLVQLVGPFVSDDLQNDQDWRDVPEVWVAYFIESAPRYGVDDSLHLVDIRYLFEIQEPEPEGTEPC